MRALSCLFLFRTIKLKSVVCSYPIIFSEFVRLKLAILKKVGNFHIRLFQQYCSENYLVRLDELVSEA